MIAFIFQYISIVYCVSGLNELFGQFFSLYNEYFAIL